MSAKGLPRGMLTIGEVSARTGLAASAIRFYEEQGLVAPLRNEGGQRRYARADLRRLSFVMISQGLGIPLGEIRGVLDRLPHDRPPTKSDWARISRRFKRDLEARIERMSALRDRLDRCIGCGCLSMQSCALYNPKDRIGARGAGPRYLMGDLAEDQG